MRFTTQHHQVAFERLTALAMGAHPFKQHNGICADINTEMADAGLFFVNTGWGYDYCAVIFKGMGLPEAPLNYEGTLLWEGQDGVNRRELAGKMAAFIYRAHLAS